MIVKRKRKSNISLIVTDSVELLLKKSKHKKGSLTILEKGEGIKTIKYIYFVLKEKFQVKSFTIKTI